MIKKPNRSHSARFLVPVSKGLPIKRQRHNSMIQVMPTTNVDKLKSRNQLRSYFSFPVKRRNYHEEINSNALQGMIIRPKGTDGN
jgi:hypothetical protein